MPIKTEKENIIPLLPGYLLQTFDPVTGDPNSSYDAGGQIDHARNDLLARTYGSQLRLKFSPNANTDIEVGAKFEKEMLKKILRMNGNW